MKNKGTGDAGASSTHQPLASTTIVPDASLKDAPSPSPIEKKESKKNISIKFGEDHFDEWWHFVPRKVGKGAARIAYKSALKKTDPDTLTTGIIRYAREVADKDDEFIAHPATWLNGERWLDEPEREKHGKRSGGNGAKRPSPHDTLLAAGAWAATSRPDTRADNGDDPDASGTGDTDSPAPGVPRVP